MKKNIIYEMYGWGVRRLPLGLKKKFRSIKIIDKLNILFRTKLKPEFVITKREKHKIFLDEDDSLHLSIHKDWDEFTGRIMYAYIKEGDVVLDLGANIGYYTLILAKLVGKSGRVYAFEPDPDNFKILKKNIKANGYENVVAVQKALSNKTERIKLFLEKDNSTRNKVYDDGYTKSTTIWIEAITLDDYFKDKNKRVDFVKMDIEGSEGRTIVGMQNLLKENKNIKIFSEFCPEAMRGCNIGPKEFFKTLEKFNFIYYNANDEEKKIESTTPEKILPVYKEKGYTNLFCIKEKDKDIILKLSQSNYESID